MDTENSTRPISDLWAFLLFKTNQQVKLHKLKRKGAKSENITTSCISSLQDLSPLAGPTEIILYEVPM